MKELSVLKSGKGMGLGTPGASAGGLELRLCLKLDGVEEKEERPADLG